MCVTCCEGAYGATVPRCSRAPRITYDVTCDVIYYLSLPLHQQHAGETVASEHECAHSCHSCRSGNRCWTEDHRVLRKTLQGEEHRRWTRQSTVGGVRSLAFLLPPEQAQTTCEWDDDRTLSTTQLSCGLAAWVKHKPGYRQLHVSAAGNTKT